MAAKYKASYYNLAVPHGPYTLLFNGVTSGLMRLPAGLAADLMPFLGPVRARTAGVGRDDWRPEPFARGDLPPSVGAIFSELRRGRFFVPAATDEASHLQRRFETMRASDPFLITITTTMDCNLGCYYCYEDKENTYLTRAGCDEILAWVEEQIRKKGHDKLYTDWYGGEPMLNRDAIDYFTARALELCTSLDVGYSSAMISNGTRWPDDARGFVERNRIRHVQFTLDGARAAHDKRRRYVLADQRGHSSFDEVVSTIDRVRGATRIYLRINVDPGSADGILSLVPLMKARGWLEPEARIYPYLAMIGPMTEHCSFLGEARRVRDFRDEFDRLNNEFQLAISAHIDARLIQHLQYYPMTIRLNCAAVGANSVVFGPDGYMYKCGLEVGDRDKAHDRLPMAVEQRAGGAYEKQLPIVTQRLTPHPWDEYDPFTHGRCSQCQYLPICMGGCPKTHFEGNEFYLEQQSRYWEENFDIVVRTYYDATAARMEPA